MVRSRLLALTAAAVAVVAAGVALTVATTCTPAPNRSGTLPASASVVASACATQLEPLGPAPLARAPAAATPLSRIEVGLRLTREFLDAQVDKQVPRTLASASGRSAGAAGKVSYTVTRGDFSWALEDDRLVARTPVSVSLQICKPILSLCPVYGSCTPQLAVTASLPVYLDARFRPRPPRVDMAVTRGCTIVGFDVTSRVRSIGQGNVKQIERRITKAVPDPAPWLERARQLTRGLPLGTDLCLSAIPRKLQQLPPRLDDQALTLGLSISAEIQASRACPVSAEPAALPPLQVAREPLSPSSIQLAQVWPWRDLGKALETAWANDPIVGSEIAIREIRSARASADAGDSGQPQVLLGLELRGRSCGGLWLVATPRVEGAALRLTALRAATPAAPEALVSKVGAALGALSVPLPAAARKLSETLGGLPARLAKIRDDDVELALGRAEIQLQTLPTAEGLQLLASRPATLTVTLRQRP